MSFVRAHRRLLLLAVCCTLSLTHAMEPEREQDQKPHTRPLKAGRPAPNRVLVREPKYNALRPSDVDKLKPHTRPTPNLIARQPKYNAMRPNDAVAPKLTDKEAMAAADIAHKLEEVKTTELTIFAGLSESCTVLSHLKRSGDPRWKPQENPAQQAVKTLFGIHCSLVKPSQELQQIFASFQGLQKDNAIVLVNGVADYMLVVADYLEENQQLLVTLSNVVYGIDLTCIRDILRDTLAVVPDEQFFMKLNLNGVSATTPIDANKKKKQKEEQANDELRRSILQALVLARLNDLKVVAFQRFTKYGLLARDLRDGLAKIAFAHTTEQWADIQENFDRITQTITAINSQISGSVKPVPVPLPKTAEKKQKKQKKEKK